MLSRVVSAFRRKDDDDGDDSGVLEGETTTAQVKTALQRMAVGKLMALILNSQLASLFGSNRSVGTAYPEQVEVLLARLYSWTQACCAVPPAR